MVFLQISQRRAKLNGLDSPASVAICPLQQLFEIGARWHLSGAATNSPELCLHCATVRAPEDVASAELFLASERAAWLTGVTLDVEGGDPYVRS
jgi:NAD(P)-dependent dehydrogenase (short-subunit alcohol dehydrogenase family)